MKVINGFTEIEATEEIKSKIQDKRLLEGDNLLVQQMHFGKTGCITLIGNRNPDPVRHQDLMDDAGAILYEGYLRKIRQNEETGA